MGKIKVLSSKVYNRIAAGEVVDRPYSIVKELVENSIDAGAKNISIDILNGGISSIEITDDGCGMDREDIVTSIKAHATSKVSKTSDLDAIKTLGFRGEALASIASVTKLSIASKTQENQIGNRLYTEGGEEVSVEEYGMNKGTKITVNNIFFNTPAREKFLRTERSEEGEISSVVAKFILGNPNIAFKYTANNKLVLQSFGDGIESAMVQVFGSNILKDCFYIDTEKNGIKINGYIGKHYFTKGNRSHQFMFLNNRTIVNQTISMAIANAYSSYIMRGRFPFYVLNLTVPTEIVDVNVHPNKLDVRFSSSNQIIYSTIYSIISKVLDGSSEAINIILNPSESSEIMPDITQKTSNNNTQNKQGFFDSLIFNDIINDQNADKNKKIDNANQSTKEDIFKENKAFLESLLNNKKPSTFIEEQPSKINQQNMDFLDKPSKLNLVGQALNTFLIFDDGIDIYIIDQHAAHERILYDKLITDFNSHNIVMQPLLLPYNLNVNNVEYDFVFSKLNMLNEMGFDICEFGRNSFKVSGIPAPLSNINLDKFFTDFLSDLNELKSITLTELLADKIAQKACKSAVKAGDKLDAKQIDILLEKLNGNLGLKCPHGRPLVVKITRIEIDKWFKRIV